MVAWSREMAQWLRGLFRGSGFNSQNPYGSSKLSITLVPEFPTPSHKKVSSHDTNEHKIKINLKYKK